MMDKKIISCKKATQLMSESMEHKLTLSQQLALKAHLAVCKTCVYCFRQLTALQKVYAHYTKAVTHVSPPQKKSLPKESRRRIKAFLKKYCSEK